MAMEMAANYNESQYIPYNNLAQFHDYKMAAFYNDQETRMLYYEYTQNQLRLKNLNNSEPSINGDSIHTPSSSSVMSTQPRLNAYDFQLCNNQNYLPTEEHVYDSLLKDNPNMCNDWHPDFGYENVPVHSRPKKKRDSKGTTKSRSKSSDRTLRRLSHVENSQMIPNFWENTAQVVDAYGAVCTIPMNRSLSGNVYPAQSCDGYREECDQYLPEGFNGLSPKVTYRSDSSHGRWQQWPWSSRGNCCMPCMPHALSPSSPLDSGLSSQSVASSPSLDAEQVQRFPECGSPVPLATFQKNQCSCSTTSFPDPNFLSPPMRSDSGRSSPWTQSAVSRLNTLTRSKKHHASGDVPIVVDVITSLDDFNNKRFSMSGIYVNPRDKNYLQTSTKMLEVEKENVKTLKKKARKAEKSSDFYKSLEREKSAHVRSPKVETGTLRSLRSEHLRDNDSEIRRLSIHNNNNKEPIHDESPEPVSTSTSNNSIDSSTQTNNKTDCEAPKLKNSSKQSEKAICELEEMYNKLNLQDYDLLDRAERRDLPTAHQDLRLLNGAKLPSLTRSKSDSFFEILGPELCNPFKKLPRAPPLRRSGVPDRVADDMAIRKQQKPGKSYQINDNAATYMLYSSYFTPSLALPNEVLLANRPDIDYDDLSYRRYFHMSSGKVSEPQPPFGIPLKPLPSQSIFSDYLHVVPSGIPPPICHPRGNPDLVRDDLAYRALRKDDPERAMYDSYSLFYRKVR